VSITFPGFNVRSASSPVSIVFSVSIRFLGFNLRSASSPVSFQSIIFQGSMLGLRLLHPQTVRLGGLLRFLRVLFSVLLRRLSRLLFGVVSLYEGTCIIFCVDETQECDEPARDLIHLMAGTWGGWRRD